MGAHQCEIREKQDVIIRKICEKGSLQEEAMPSSPPTKQIQQTARVTSCVDVGVMRTSPLLQIKCCGYAKNKMRTEREDGSNINGTIHKHTTSLIYLFSAYLTSLYKSDRFAFQYGLYQAVIWPLLACNMVHIANTYGGMAQKRGRLCSKRENCNHLRFSSFFPPIFPNFAAVL